MSADPVTHREGIAVEFKDNDGVEGVADLENQDPRELFQQVSHIALCMSYDLVDKLRWWEKETMKLTDEEIEKRIPHMATLLEQLKTAYVHFADVDL